jgi:hypothetical protein
MLVVACYLLLNPTFNMVCYITDVSGQRLGVQQGKRRKERLLNPSGGGGGLLSRGPCPSGKRPKRLAEPRLLIGEAPFTPFRAE